MDAQPSQKILSKISQNIKQVIRGQDVTIRYLLAGLIGGGHILLEDHPGTGKTTMAKALALSIDAEFKRIQFTPDLLPSDIIGVSIFDQRENAFTFHRGPVFTNVLLADEINRASPRTQSALLEAMAEGQVSADGKRRRLDDLFFVIATQNPVGTAGTYPLPEAQMDRFALKFSLGYVDPEIEVAILTDQKSGHPLNDIRPCLTRDEILALQREARQVRIGDDIKRYIVDLVGATRTAPGVALGASPRASLALMTISKALALVDGIEFVTPELIQELAGPVVAHRLVLNPESRFTGTTTLGLVQSILTSLPVPT